jgi:hypothetical protein
MLDEDIAADARPLADALMRALERPHLLPDLYSTRDDHATIGSVSTRYSLALPAGRGGLSS